MAIEAALHAGSYIAQQTHNQLAVQNKQAGSSLASQVFTEVDMESERLIIENLSPSLEQYDVALLSEESPDDKQRFEKDYFWCIDPLDGTLPFIEQTNGYSVSIALVANNGTPIIGVIYDPNTGTLYHAIKDIGTFKNNELWTPTAQNTHLSLVCDRSFLKHPKYNTVINQLQRISAGKLNIIKHGGAAMNAMWVLENQPAVYFKFPKNETGGGSIWDYAASACIFNELNAPAQNFAGGQLNLNNPASTFMNEQGIFYASSKQVANDMKALLVLNTNWD